MNNKYLVWMRKHPVWSVLIVLFVIAFISSSTTKPNTRSVQTQQPEQNQESQVSTAESGTKTASPTPVVKKSETPVPADVKAPSVPAEYKSALATAKTYANTMHMSKARLYDQLTSEYGEKFTAAAAQYAIDNIQANWNLNALLTARNYQNTMNMSPARIRDQLTSANGEKFTQAEADYAIQHLNE